MGEGCIRLQNKAGSYLRDRHGVYLEKEQQIRDILGQMPRAEQIAELLQAVGLDMAAFYGLYDRQKIEDALFYAKDLKDRYTVLWLYHDLFGTRKPAHPLLKF